MQYCIPVRLQSPFPIRNLWVTCIHYHWYSSTRVPQKRLEIQALRCVCTRMYVHVYVPGTRVPWYHVVRTYVHVYKYNIISKTTTMVWTQQYRWYMCTYTCTMVPFCMVPIGTRVPNGMEINTPVHTRVRTYYTCTYVIIWVLSACQHTRHHSRGALSVCYGSGSTALYTPK